ncbi:phosphatase PAP2 family protein [Propionicimonas sp.]|uniref:phosphatase PAP2 family protein n=1 Tax=Propionicimonas sp. TaxID=1955623 RepID=UPI0039E37066
MARPEPDAEGDAAGAASRVEVGTGAAIGLTGLVGAVVFSLLMIASASVYEAVAEDDGVAGLDRPVLDAMIRLRTPLSETVATAFTELGTTVPMVVIGIFLISALYLTHRRRTIIVLMVVAAAGSITFTIVGKALVGRSRPPLVDAVPPYEASFSFPSGHTLNSTVVAGMLAYLVVWLAARVWQRACAVVGAALWALAMGLSRVFLGHHWLTDVVFAWLFGLAWLALLITVHQLLLRRQARRPAA